MFNERRYVVNVIGTALCLVVTALLGEENEDPMKVLYEIVTGPAIVVILLSSVALGFFGPLRFVKK